MAHDLASTADRALVVQEKLEALNTAHKAKTKPLEAELADLETALISLMDEGSLETAKSKTTTVDKKSKMLTSFEDFEAFAAFALRKKALHLFERRLGQKAYAEMREQLGGKKPLPGIREFTKTYVNIRRT